MRIISLAPMTLARVGFESRSRGKIELLYIVGQKHFYARGLLSVAGWIRVIGCLMPQIMIKCH